MQFHVSLRGLYHAMRAAVYCRVSTLLQEKKGYSLEEQAVMLPELARLKKYTVSAADIYMETASGTNDDRPEYNRMLSLIVEGHYQAVFVIEKSRLGRTESREEEERVVKALQSFGCIVCTPHSTYDVSSLEGEFMWDVNSAVDRLDRKRIKYRMHTGKVGKAKLGGYYGRIALTGYNQVRDIETGKFKLEIDDAAMAPVKETFNLALQGMSIAGIARELYKQGYRSQANTPITPTRVMHWLKNPHFAGYTHIGTHNKTKAKVLSEENHFLTPIVTKEQFKLVQELLKRRSAKREKRARNPLTAILRCPSCDRPMKVGGPTLKKQYMCSGANIFNKSCNGRNGKSLSYWAAHEMVLEAIPMLLEHIQKTSQRSFNAELSKKQNNTPKTELKRLEGLLEQTKKRILNNIKEQEMAPSDFRRQRIAELEKEYKNLEAQIEEHSLQKIANIPEIKGIEKILSKITAKDLDELDQLFSLLFKAVRYQRDGATNHYNYRITSFVTAWGVSMRMRNKHQLHLM